MDINENENLAMLRNLRNNYLGHKIHRKLYFTYFYFTAFIPKAVKQPINSSFFSKEQAIMF